MEHYGTTVKGFEFSEDLKQMEINHFVTKRDPAKYAAKNAAEKQELKTRMYNHPAKNHSPVGLN